MTTPPSARRCVIGPPVLLSRVVAAEVRVMLVRVEWWRCCESSVACAIQVKGVAEGLSIKLGEMMDQPRHQVGDKLHGLYSLPMQQCFIVLAFLSRVHSALLDWLRRRKSAGKGRSSNRNRSRTKKSRQQSAKSSGL